MSKQSGFVCDTSCTCKASAMGRCNHVCGLLFAVLDYTEKYGYMFRACTSLPCEWNKGRTTKNNPERIFQTRYGSCKRKKVDNIISFDSRPTSLQQSTLYQAERNSFIINLQSSTASRPGAVPCMWETILTLGYDDYSLDAEEQSVLQMKCHQLVAILWELAPAFPQYKLWKNNNPTGGMQRGGCDSQHPLARLLCLCRLTDQSEIS